MSDSLRPHELQPTRLLHPWDFPGQNTGVSCHFLLQEIFLTQGLNPGLLHCRQTLYRLSHQGSPIRCYWMLIKTAGILVIRGHVTQLLGWLIGPCLQWREDAAWWLSRDPLAGP